jgi:hypothetical protein
VLNNKQIKRFSSKEDFENATVGGSYFNVNEKGGTMHLKTNYLPTNKKQLVELQF